ncbi:ferrous iron transport protein A [Alkalithermobacter thermoalcaliphilus JW-YL-7 = DSM 7308]|uniref:FeoA family protein n=1 Tax=Alkalithermobacter thermoalcaliphilus JW-YL-7 = DSM 7308 TaxID=1121328 RepID=A0A150FNR4_CLOPD|nr:FeoA family protein [[Clostridium] paradoxum JW-YL-7 = DSM 7308]SHK85560.1 ferrous iron transport protein A [[Clostridium] paradoxum JW-YL-7 = DSM 7308]
MALYELRKNQKCTIEKMPSNSLLQSLGLRQGIVVSVMSKQPFGGPIVVKVGNRSIAVDKDIAKNIEIKVVS